MKYHKILSKEDIVKETKKILNNLSEGDISVSAYDTGWVARIPSEINHKKPMFPQSLKWILKNQLTDGSWGTKDVEYYHDRIINTLSCIIALKLWSASPKSIARGIDYINTNLSNLTLNNKYETVGFELVFTSMLITAKKLGFILDYNNNLVNTYFEIKDKKLQKIDFNKIYSSPTTLAHSFEFFYEIESIDIKRLLFHQGPNGSFGCSPASTAFMYMRTKNLKSKTYLTNLIKRFHGAVPTLFPFEIFEKNWTLNNILESGLYNIVEKEAYKHIKYINLNWKKNGLALSKEFHVCDIDDTSLGIKLLRLSGFKKSPRVFKKYENENGYFCYQEELNSSPTHIANLLFILSELPNFNEKQRLILKAKKFLSSNFSSLIRDKWNFSPYYTTSRLIKVMPDNNLLIDFVLSKQNSDGNWGNVEETAYAIDTLLSAHKSKKYIKQIIKGGKFIINNYHKAKIINIWIGKSLYTPYNIRNSKLLGIIYKILNLGYFDYE